MRWSLIALLPGCLAVSHQARPTAREQAVAIAGGVAVSAAAVAAAQAVHDASIAQQAGVAIGTAAIPMATIYLGEEPDDPTTEGEIYSNLGTGLVSSLVASMSFAAPLLGTVVAGESQRRSSGATWGTVGGVLVGGFGAGFLGDHLPKWARVVVGALVVGSAATLGYQLGGGGPP